MIAFFFSDERSEDALFWQQQAHTQNGKSSWSGDKLLSDTLLRRAYDVTGRTQSSRRETCVKFNLPPSLARPSGSPQWLDSKYAKFSCFCFFFPSSLRRMASRFQCTFYKKKKRKIPARALVAFRMCGAEMEARTCFRTCRNVVRNDFQNSKSDYPLFRLRSLFENFSVRNEVHFRINQGKCLPKPLSCGLSVRIDIRC